MFGFTKKRIIESNGAGKLELRETNEGFSVYYMMKNMSYNISKDFIGRLEKFADISTLLTDAFAQIKKKELAQQKVPKDFVYNFLKTKLEQFEEAQIEGISNIGTFKEIGVQKLLKITIGMNVSVVFEGIGQMQCEEYYYTSIDGIKEDSSFYVIINSNGYVCKAFDKQLQDFVFGDKVLEENNIKTIEKLLVFIRQIVNSHKLYSGVYLFIDLGRLNYEISTIGHTIEEAKENFLPKKGYARVILEGNVNYGSVGKERKSVFNMIKEEKELAHERDSDDADWNDIPNYGWKKFKIVGAFEDDIVLGIYDTYEFHRGRIVGETIKELYRKKLLEESEKVNKAFLEKFPNEKTITFGTNFELIGKILKGLTNEHSKYKEILSEKFGFGRTNKMNMEYLYFFTGINFLFYYAYGTDQKNLDSQEFLTTTMGINIVYDYYGFIEKKNDFKIFIGKNIYEQEESIMTMLGFSNQLLFKAICKTNKDVAGGNAFRELLFHFTKAFMRRKAFIDTLRFRKNSDGEIRYSYEVASYEDMLYNKSGTIDNSKQFINETFSYYDDEEGTMKVEQSYSLSKAKKKLEENKELQRKENEELLEMYKGRLLILKTLKGEFKGLVKREISIHKKEINAKYNGVPRWLIPGGEIFDAKVSGRGITEIVFENLISYETRSLIKNANSYVAALFNLLELIPIFLDLPNLKDKDEQKIRDLNFLKEIEACKSSLRFISNDRLTKGEEFSLLNNVIEKLIGIVNDDRYLYNDSNNCLIGFGKRKEEILEEIKKLKSKEFDERYDFSSNDGKINRDGTALPETIPEWLLPMVEKDAENDLPDWLVDAIKEEGKVNENKEPIKELTEEEKIAKIEKSRHSFETQKNHDLKLLKDKLEELKSKEEELKQQLKIDFEKAKKAFYDYYQNEKNQKLILGYEIYKKREEDEQKRLEKEKEDAYNKKHGLGIPNGGVKDWL